MYVYSYCTNEYIYIDIKILKQGITAFIRTIKDDESTRKNARSSSERFRQRIGRTGRTR